MYSSGPPASCFRAICVTHGLSETRSSRSLCTVPSMPLVDATFCSVSPCLSSASVMLILLWDKRNSLYCDGTQKGIVERRKQAAHTWAALSMQVFHVHASSKT